MKSYFRFSFILLRTLSTKTHFEHGIFNHNVQNVAAAEKATIFVRLHFNPQAELL